MTPNTINGEPVMTADVFMPRAGVWHADVVSDGDALTGAVTLTVDGVDFVGTVRPGRSGLNGGLVLTKVVGGKNKMPTPLGAKNYASGARVRLVVDDILREAGEILSPTSDAATLARFFDGGRWERSAGKASRCLSDVLEPTGAIWKVLRDGTVWVGPADFPEQTVEHVLEDEDWINGVLTIAPTKPDLLPGVTFLGQRISYVTHRLTENTLQTEATLVDAPANLLERMLEPVRREIDFSRKYSARVVSQGADGSLSVLVDNALLKGRGIDKVAIRTGFPGSVKVASGARVMVGFDGGDPDKPYAEGWDGTSYEQIQIGTGTLPAARQGDMTLSSLTPQNVVALAGLLVCAAPGAPPVANPAVIAAAAIPGAPLPVPITIPGVSSSGNPKILE